jgi:iron complex transport system ATP-binding protein
MTGISAQGLRVFRDGHQVIAGSNFDIPEGSTAAIIGPNGSGKSSILHAIAGVLEIEGRLDVCGQAPDKALKNIAYVLQYMPITPGVPLTVREVVQMGRYSTLGLFGRATAADRERVSWAMDKLAISNLADKNIANLSGGQRQRVFVAQALTQEHTILLLDEPLTGLDVPSAKVIDQIIHDEPDDGCTVVFTTHDLDEARAADYVILTAGRVVAAGSPDEVLTPEHLAEAYGLGALHPAHTGEHGVLDVAHEDPEMNEPISVRQIRGEQL